MDAVLQHPVTTMTVEPNLRLHAVPCKKRPLSWYKPPACPRNLLAISPSTSGRDHPVNLGSDGSPINLTHSVSHVSQGLSVSPTILSHPVSAVTLGYPRCPISPSHSASPAHSPARSPTPTHTVGPASPASSSSSHEDSLQGPLQVQGQLTAPAPAPALWPCALVARDAKSSALGTPTSFASSLRPPVARKQSDFSIEHILRGAGTPRSPPPSSPVHQPDGHFEWLQCTRYRPPKLPRSRRRDGPAQRRLGRNPRIPFSPQQVAVLEARFSRSHYLSSADVAELSAQLELSETRVKIWFQNRRARERRDGDGRSTTSPPHNLTVTAKLAKPPTPSHLPRSTTSAFSVPKSQPIQNAVESIIGSQKI